MRRAAAGARVAQAWIAPLGDDPEALSAHMVARERLPAGRHLVRLERRRLIELRGALPDRARLERLLGESTQFFNPHKERCTLRTRARERPPLAAGDVAVLVWERGGARRTGAERWLRHETGLAIEVNEGTAWVLGFEGAGDPMEQAEDLTRLRERRQGLLCNPRAQAFALAVKTIPLPWLAVADATGRNT